MSHRGGIASTGDLRRAGVSTRGLERAVRAGTLTRLRRGWYATNGAPDPVRQAVLAGGALTCCSALSLMGAWTMPSTALHIRVGRGSRIHPNGHRVHWSRDSIGAPVDSAALSIRQLIGCADTRAVVVALDSVLNLRILEFGHLATVLSESPRGRAVLPLLDARSESGLEIIARLGLRRCRLQFRSQAPIPGVGRVDFLIGDRLVLEVDGRRWHDFDDDRARDRLLIVAEYVVIRASYLQVMNDWPSIETQIIDLVRRREHLWRASHGKLGHEPRSYRGQR
ncbi:MAG TPA: type IV toxin-antitoxin system AbiEi family antitoxin domain-containing protein [Pseudolysinimonas sp.]